MIAEAASGMTAATGPAGGPTMEATAVDVDNLVGMLGCLQAASHAWPMPCGRSVAPRNSRVTMLPQMVTAPLREQPGREII